MLRKWIANWKPLLQLAWPLIIANSFWNLQMTIDRVFLGSYSTESLGAAMAVMGIFWTPMALLQQTSAYVTTFVAQYLGAKQENQVGAAVWQAIYLSVVGGLLFLLFIPFTPWMFRLMGHAPTIQALEAAYFSAICFSALPTALVAAFSGFFTGLGETKTVMKINAVGLVANVVCDYVLIFGHWGFPALGITGAGYATAFAACMSALYGGYLIFTAHHNRVYALFSGWRLHINLMNRFLRFGLPSGCQWALEGLAFTVFLVILGRFPNGEAALASASIAVTVMMLSVLPVLGMAQSVMVMVGQRLGEDKPSLAEKASWYGVQISVLYILVMGCTFLLFPEFYLGWFKNENQLLLWQDVQKTVPYLLMFVAGFTLFDSVNLNLSFALKGAGDTRFVSLVALVLPWPLMVLPTWVLRDESGAIFYAWGAASVYAMVQAMVFFFRFKQGKWKGMRVIS